MKQPATSTGLYAFSLTAGSPLPRAKRCMITLARSCVSRQLDPVLETGASTFVCKSRGLLAPRNSPPLAPAYMLFSITAGSPLPRAKRCMITLARSCVSRQLDLVLETGATTFACESRGLLALRNSSPLAPASMLCFVLTCNVICSFCVDRGFKWRCLLPVGYHSVLNHSWWD